jgi:iron complex outermembrane recepter protein
MKFLWISAAATLITTCVSSVAVAETSVTPPSGIEEIVVTAQRREESLQSTPLAVTAFTGDTLRALGVEGSMDLARFTPGLQTAPVFGEGNIPNIAIRGVGLNDFRDYNESPSAVYVDEVYKGALGSLDFQLFDVDRVEVLKGPQGTLFGRNATGGLIQYITRKPTRDTDGYVRLSVGSFNDINVEAAAGGALSDDVAARLSLVHHQHNGTERNRNPLGKDGNALDLWGERGQLAFSLPQDGSLLLTIEHGDNHNDGGNSYRYAPSYFLPNGLAAINEPTKNAVVGSNDLSDINVSAGPFLTTSFTSGTARLEWKLHAANVVAISNYQTFHKRQEGDCDSMPVVYCRTHYEADTEQFSQEVRLQGTQQGVRWDVGAYYLSLKTSGIQMLFGPIAQDFFGQPFSYTAFEPNTKSWAVFGQVAYDVLPSVTLTGGLRYTNDNKDMFQSFLNGVVPGGVIYDQNTVGDLAKRTDTSVSFVGNVSWRPMDDFMIYGGVSRAPKSGTVNSGFAPPPATQYVVKPEQLTDTEAGVKSKWLNGRLQVNATAFHYQYKDYQAFVFQGLAQRLFNVDATVNGAELEVKAKPLAHAILSIGVGYLDTRAHNVADASGAVRDRTMVLAPTLSLNALARYSWDTWAGSEIGLQLDASSNSSVFFDNLNQPALREGGHTVADSRLEWVSGNRHWQVAGSVQNLTEKRYRIYAFDLTALLGYVQEIYNRPRTFEVSLMYSF